MKKIEAVSYHRVKVKCRNCSSPQAGFKKGYVEVSAKNGQVGDMPCDYCGNLALSVYRD